MLLDLVVMGRLAGTFNTYVLIKFCCGCKWLDREYFIVLDLCLDICRYIEDLFQVGCWLQSKEQINNLCKAAMSLKLRLSFSQPHGFLF